MDLTFDFLGKLVLAGGGLAAMSYALFQFLGGKWLEAKFGERLQNLKAEQDRALRHVQSTIDREIHRAEKLYDSEFTALSECWRLLRDSFDQSVSGIMSQTAQVERYADAELDRHLSKLEMEDWEKREMIAKTGKERFDAYYIWTEHRRYLLMRKAWSDFRTQLDTNSIFFPEGLVEKLKVVEMKIIAANVEFESRLQQRVNPYLREEGRSMFEETNKLRTEGGPLMDELERLVRNRLWSAASSPEAKR